MKYGLIFILLALFNVGCATVDNSLYADFKDEKEQTRSFEKYTIKGLRVTYEQDQELSDENFSVFQMTFQNNSHNWIRLNNATIDMGSPELNKKVYVVAGKDLKAWAEAVQQKKAIEDYNNQLFMSSIAGASAVVGVTSKSANTQKMALGVMATTLTVDAINSLVDTGKSLSQVGMYPDSHLLAGEIAIPPGLFQKRWIVLNSNEPYRSFIVKVKQEDFNVRLAFKVKDAPYTEE